jgi:hypothetical protein
MSNNKQMSVEYLVEQLFPKALSAEQYYHIEKAKEMQKEEIKASYADGYKEGYKRALDYMTDTIKNKIEVMENANNEFKKGTANTTHTTFLCTEFVSDASKGATLPRCIRCGKTQRIHPIITKNNEQQ